jgi:hypothetical protein
MTFPVLIETSNGQFAAALVGAPTIRAVGPTRAEALAALQVELAQRLARGELVSLDLVSTGVSGLAGTYRTDPTLRDICTEAYHTRDAESQT